MLQAIQDDLESSPFTAEGHRKVWARLRILRDIRASRERVLRLMREHHLLSPHRGPRARQISTTDGPQPIRPTRCGEPMGFASKPWTMVWCGSSRPSIIATGIGQVSTR
ncbi:transposase [Paraburkholderia mimosarum]|uniref:IS3 family transposase n=1 Tax=Paraburkholderia mimosarum TaxID=312026 RepID=UPI001ABB2330